MSKANPAARIRAAALAAIEKEKGRLIPEEVVSIAEAIDHPLHGCFTWDDGEAATLYRLEEARQLIREVKVEFVSRDIVMTAPFYISDPNPARRENAYVQLAPLKKRKDDARRVIIDELSRIQGAITRAKSVAAVLGLEDDLEAMIEAVACVKRRLDDAA